MDTNASATNLPDQQQIKQLQQQIENLQKQLQQWQEQQSEQTQAALRNFRDNIQSCCDRLDSASSIAIKGVNEAINQFRPSDFKELADQVCHRVDDTAITVLRNVGKVASWFYWKKLLLAFATSTMVAVLVGMYLNDEMPWEMHSRVSYERELGRAVRQAWPHLESKDQRLLADLSEVDPPASINNG